MFNDIRRNRALVLNTESVSSIKGLGVASLGVDRGYGRGVTFGVLLCSGSGSTARVTLLFVCGLELSCCFNFSI